MIPTMKKFYTVKNKSSTASESNPNLLDKLSRRYSSIGGKFLRKSPGRKGVRDVVSGSYNMRGNQSDDLRPEIGLPVLISKIDRTDLDTIERKVPQSPVSTDSDGEVFLDAKSSFPNFADIKFSFLPETSSGNSSLAGSYELRASPPIEKFKSQSAQNLHRTELKVFLKRPPSMEAVEDREVVDSCYDFPKRMPPIEMVVNSCVSLGSNNDCEGGLDESSYFDKTVNDGSNTKYKSNTSCNRLKCQSSESIRSDEDDFDFDSVSLQSLNARNVFLSIDELNELTRQINDAEDIQDIDYEYVEHREHLKPCERRVTLLRNKETPKFINITDKKEKFAKKWTGIKHWIGEEKSKIRDVVHRHAALQRVGARSDSVESSPASRSASEQPSEHHESEQSPQRDSEDHEMLKDKSISLPKGAYHDHFEGQNGFEELRRYVKQGGDFGKELATILQERIDAEQAYAKSLSKMATKLNKACRDIPGSIADAWKSVSTEMESRSEVHRQFSTSLTDEMVKPLKTILENQHKSRKAIEGNVDKSVRLLTEWRGAEVKGKKNSHSAARENEKLQDAMLDVRIQRSPSIAILPHGGSNRSSSEKDSKDKDSTKLDGKRKKAEDAVKRADVEYYQLCIRAERARVDWEISVLRGSSMLQSLENQRLTHFKDYVRMYHQLTADMQPLMEKIVQRIEPQITNCNVQKDLAVLKNIRRASEGPSEQLLPDFYCEHTTLAMNRERRKQSLVKLLALIRQDLERERKSRNGLKSLTQSMGTADNQNITDKLYHIRSMLTYLEGAKYKLQSALLELDHRPRANHPLAQHIQVTRDRTGLQQSILKVPLWLKNDENENSSHNISNDDLDCYCAETPESPKEIVIECENELLVQKINGKNNQTNRITSTNGKPANGSLPNGKRANDSPTYCDRGIADGNSNQPDSDFDEFSSDDETTTKSETSKIVCAENIKPMTILGKCKALYSYTPKLYDELELLPGDIIEIHSKQEDGWWMGQLRNTIGIFPATYVEELP